MGTKIKRAVAACGWWLTLLLITHKPAVSRADEDALKSTFEINDEDPESSVPTQVEAMRKPLQMGYHIMLLSERAEAATARGDHRAAAKYWRAMGKAAPDRSLPSTRACRELEAAGDYESALSECRDALGKGGVTVEDNQHYVQLLLRKAGQLSDADVADIEAVAAHLKEQLPKEQGELEQATLMCQLASRLSDAARLETCVTQLQTLAPQNPQTVVYQWSLAMLERNYDRAGSLLAKAKTTALASTAIGTMQAALLAANPPQSLSRLSTDKRSAIFGCGLVIASGAAAALWFRRRRKRFAQAA